MLSCLKEREVLRDTYGGHSEKGAYYPYGFDVMKLFEATGFTIKEIIIKQQHNCKATGYWAKNSIKYNFFLIAHEYLFIFKK